MNNALGLYCVFYIVYYLEYMSKNGVTLLHMMNNALVYKYFCIELKENESHHYNLQYIIKNVVTLL